MTYWVSDTIAAAAECVCVTPDALVAKGNGWRCARGRWMVMLALHEKRHTTLNEIGRRLGGRNHSTIWRGIRQARILRMTDEGFAEAYAWVAATVPAKGEGDADPS